MDGCNYQAKERKSQLVMMEASLLLEQITSFIDMNHQITLGSRSRV